MQLCITVALLWQWRWPLRIQEHFCLLPAGSLVATYSFKLFLCISLWIWPLYILQYWSLHTGNKTSLHLPVSLQQPTDNNEGLSPHTQGHSSNHTQRTKPGTMPGEAKVFVPNSCHGNKQSFIVLWAQLIYLSLTISVQHHTKDLLKHTLKHM